VRITTLADTREKKLIDRKYRSMVRKWNDPALKASCEPVWDGDDLSYLDDMRRVCRAFPSGVGLAASQIGILKRAAFIAPPSKSSFWIINPTVIEHSNDTETAVEGCLSYPETWVEVPRFKWINLQYFLRTNLKNPVIEKFYDFEARIVLHEMDHMDGICLVGDNWRGQ